VTAATSLHDGVLTLKPTSGAKDLTGFAVLLSAERIGTVALQHAPGKAGRTAGSVRWNFNAGTGQSVAARAIGLAIDFSFAKLGWNRVEARVAADDSTGLRYASIAGLRREGVARTAGKESDQVILGRISTDPPAFSREGFVAILNAGLPRKRVIGQGILRDEQGRILLCELTYKKEWDLPGGVIEVGESPAFGLVRELEEELGITVTVNSLVTMNWLPSWRQWDDACLFVFALGTVDSSIVDEMHLQKSEIAAVHWCDAATIAEKATGATIELTQALSRGPLPGYREAPLQPE